MTQRTPRRDFLFGLSSNPIDECPTRGTAEHAKEPFLIRLSRKAMAGEFEICLPVAIAGEATAAALEALDLVQAIERQLSFFQPQSDISTINRAAADAAVEVEPRLFALLQAAMQLWRESGGAYDLTATPLWEAWGFARRAGAIPSPEQLAEAQTLVGGQWIELDESHGTIRLLRRGVRLNLGSIGKGYAVDRAVEHLLAAGVSDFLVHGSYSSVAARGFADASSKLEAASDPAAADHDHGYMVPDMLPGSAAGHGRSASRTRCGTSAAWDRSNSTAGPWARRGRSSNRSAIAGGAYGHILDPRTGRPAEGVHSVVVMAPTAAEADALSTAFYVMGPEAALSYCRQHPSIAAILFAAADGKWQLHHCGLGDESAELLAALARP